MNVMRKSVQIVIGDRFTSTINKNHLYEDDTNLMKLCNMYYVRKIITNIGMNVLINLE
jgi:hypothetical protein